MFTNGSNLKHQVFFRQNVGRDEVFRQNLNAQRTLFEASVDEMYVEKMLSVDKGQ